MVNQGKWMIVWDKVVRCCHAVRHRIFPTLLCLCFLLGLTTSLSLAAFPLSTVEKYPVYLSQRSNAEDWLKARDRLLSG